MPAPTTLPTPSGRASLLQPLQARPPGSELGAPVRAPQSLAAAPQRPVAPSPRRVDAETDPRPELGAGPAPPPRPPRPPTPGPSAAASPLASPRSPAPPSVVSDTSVGDDAGTLRRPRRLGLKGGPRPSSVPPLSDLTAAVASLRKVAQQPLLAQLPFPEQLLAEATVGQLLAARRHLDQLCKGPIHPASYLALAYAVDGALSAVGAGLQGARLIFVLVGSPARTDWFLAPPERAFCGGQGAGDAAPEDTYLRCGRTGGVSAALARGASALADGASVAVYEAVVVLGLSTHQLLLRLRTLEGEGVRRLEPFRRPHHASVHVAATHGTQLLQLRGLERCLRGELTALGCALRLQHERLAGGEHALRARLGGDPSDAAACLRLPQQLACPVLAHRAHPVCNGPQASQLAELYALACAVTTANLAEVERVQDALRRVSELSAPTPRP